MQNGFIPSRQRPNSYLIPASSLEFRVSSESDTVKTGGVIHPEAEFLSSCEFMTPDKLEGFKIQWWDRHGIDVSIPKGIHRKEERGHRFQASPKPNGANSIRFSGWRSIFGLMLPLPGPLGHSITPTALPALCPPRLWAC